MSERVSVLFLQEIRECRNVRTRESHGPIWNGGFSSTERKRERRREGGKEGRGRVISDVIEFRSGPFCGAAAAVVVKRDGMIAIPRQADAPSRSPCRRRHLRACRREAQVFQRRRWDLDLCYLESNLQKPYLLLHCIGSERENSLETTYNAGKLGKTWQNKIYETVKSWHDNSP